MSRMTGDPSRSVSGLEVYSWVCANYRPGINETDTADQSAQQSVVSSYIFD